MKDEVENKNEKISKFEENILQLQTEVINSLKKYCQICLFIYISFVYYVYYIVGEQKGKIEQTDETLNRLAYMWSKTCTNDILRAPSSVIDGVAILVKSKMATSF